jgi:hypothetical protein
MDGPDATYTAIEFARSVNQPIDDWIHQYRLDFASRNISLAFFRPGSLDPNGYIDAEAQDELMRPVSIADIENDPCNAADRSGRNGRPFLGSSHVGADVYMALGAFFYNVELGTNGALQFRGAEGLPRSNHHCTREQFPIPLCIGEEVEERSLSGEPIVHPAERPGSSSEPSAGFTNPILLVNLEPLLDVVVPLTL